MERTITDALKHADEWKNAELTPPARAAVQDLIILADGPLCKLGTFTQTEKRSSD